MRPYSAASRSAASSRPASARPTSSASHRSASAKPHTHSHSASTRHSSSTRTNPASEGRPAAASALSAFSSANAPSSSALVAGLPSVPLPSAPLASLPPSHRPLFAYYRSRIEGFEAERQDLLSRLGTLSQHSQPAASNSATHASATLTAALAAVERERSEERVKASEERRRRLECEAAMRAMTAERLADKKRLAQLLALTLPKRAAHQQFIQRNHPPQSTTHNKENSHHTANTSTASTGQQPSEASQWKQLISYEQTASELSDREWRRQVDVLAGERRRREKEWEERERQLVGWEEQVRRERDRLRVELHEVMSEYMQLRHTAQHNERVALERLTALAAQHHQAITHLHTVTHPSAASASSQLLASTASRSTSTRDRDSDYERPWSSAARVVDDRIIEYYSGDMHDLQARNSQLSHRLTQLAASHTQHQQQQRQLHSALADDSQRWQAKYERECERRALQCEGYETDLRRMRERLWMLEELVVQVGQGRGSRDGMVGGRGVDVGDALYEMDVAGVEAEIGAMDQQLTSLTERLALSEKSTV